MIQGWARYRAAHDRLSTTVRLQARPSDLRARSRRIGAEVLVDGGEYTSPSKESPLGRLQGGQVARVVEQGRSNAVIVRTSVPVRSNASTSAPAAAVRGSRSNRPPSTSVAPSRIDTARRCRPAPRARPWGKLPYGSTSRLSTKRHLRRDLPSPSRNRTSPQRAGGAGPSTPMSAAGHSVAAVGRAVSTPALPMPTSPRCRKCRPLKCVIAAYLGAFTCSPSRRVPTHSIGGRIN